MSERTDRERRIYCARWGHTRIREYCFGYHHCARCGAQLGDSLGGVYSDDTAVYPSHIRHFHATGERMQGCKCPENAKTLGKRDLKLVPRYDAFGGGLLPPWTDKSGKPEPEVRR